MQKMIEIIYPHIAIPMTINYWYYYRGSLTMISLLSVTLVKPRKVPLSEYLAAVMVKLDDYRIHAQLHMYMTCIL